MKYQKNVNPYKEYTLETLQEIFNNREITIGFWMVIAIVASLFTKPMKNFLKLSMPR